MALQIFASTGEASGDMLAATLADAIRAFEPDARFSGIGGERMRAAGFALTGDTRWAGVGHIEALRRIPPLLVRGVRHALWLRAHPQDLVVLVDFGAYNLRFAKMLRALGYRAPILYYFPPGAWFDNEAQARAVARVGTPLTAFAHQRDFYAALGLEIAYFGHPLPSLLPPQPPRAVAPPGGGRVAVLPGSRSGELKRHVAPLLGACALLHERRPRLEIVIGAADNAAERTLAAAIAESGLPISIARGVRPALAGADVALVASGTAVLEAALLGVPQVAFYVLPRAQLALAKRAWKRPYFTLPNLVLDRAVVPERFQGDASPAGLAQAIEDVLRDPSSQQTASAALRAALGPPDALARCAAFAVALARGSSARAA